MKEKYNIKLGHWGEEIATNFLKKNNYYIIDRRWQRREGEIDIIAYDCGRRFLTFIEVKTRTSNTYGIPEESIGNKKMEKLQKIVYKYVLESGYKGDYRLDAIFIKKNIGNIRIKHLMNINLY